MDSAIDLDQLPLVVDEQEVTIRTTEAGDLTISQVKLTKGHDARVTFKGLPDDLC